MNNVTGWTKGLVVVGAMLTLTSVLSACASYPTEPRYSTRPTPAGQGAYPNQPTGSAPYPGAAQYPGATPYNGQPAPYEAPPPATAPIGDIQGGALPPPGSVPSSSWSNSHPNYPAPSSGTPTPSSPSYYPSPSAPAPGGTVAYVIQPGDTISGVGRRFRTPVQSLIDLNNLGPQASISAGQQIRLPATATDTGRDPYATGPAPVGVVVSEGAVPPPPPPPVRQTPAPVTTARPTPVTPAPSRPPVSTPAPLPPSASTGSLALQWPVRGEVVRRFGPVGMGERNNGINIGAAAGAVVTASAPGRVAYVGSDLVGQGLTVLIVHRDGWRTVYGHLGSATVDDGDDVRAGQQIGTVGLTAGDGRPSIHFETRRMQGDEPVAIDPLTVLPR